MFRIKKAQRINSNDIAWIDWVQFVFIVLAAPFFLFPKIKYAWIFSIIFFIWIIRWVKKKIFFDRTILDWSIWSLLIIIFINCVFIPDLEFSLPKIAGVFFGIIFFYGILGLLKTENFIKLGILGFIGGGFILSLFSILGMQWSRELFLNKIVNNISGFIPKIDWNLPGAARGINSTALGGILIIFIPLFIIILVNYLKNKKENFLIFKRSLGIPIFLLFVIIIFGILFLSLSVNAWIALILSIWILFLPWKWKGYSLLTVVLIIALFFCANFEAKSTITKTIKHDIDARKNLWLIGINEVNKHPLRGVGINRIRLLPSVSSTTHVHNHLLHTGAELGIPGLIAYLSILIGMGYMCLDIWRKSSAEWMRMSALGLGCGQLAQFLFGMGDSIPLGAKAGIFFWFSLALITATYNYMKKKDSGLRS